MKKKIALLLSAVMAVSLLAACGAKTPNEPETTAPTTSEVTLESGSVTVYDFGDSKLHVYASGDALGDVAYIVEGQDALVGIELPSFTDGLNAWQDYVSSLNKPMDDIFLCDHVTGGSYVADMNVMGTQGAKDSIAAGSTYATTEGLYETFGDDFHGGPDMAYINKVVSGTVTVAGIDFNLIDHGETYDLEIPSMNAVYTHMLGKTSHSILTSTAHMDSMLETLKGYQSAGYDMILTAHSGVEGQDAVTEKISYVEKAKELAENNDNADSFMAAMKEAFPDYTGENYLEMSAGYLFPSDEAVDDAKHVDASDDVVVRGARCLLLEQVLERDAVEIVADDALQPLPHGQGGARSAARASVRVLFETGDGREPTLGQTQDLADGIVLWCASQPVAALIAARGAQNVRFAQHGHDLFQIFFRDLLPLRDVLERDIAVALMCCQIEHHAQGVPAFCGYFHG